MGLFHPFQGGCSSPNDYVIPLPLSTPVFPPARASVCPRMCPRRGLRSPAHDSPDRARLTLHACGRPHIRKRGLPTSRWGADRRWRVAGRAGHGAGGAAAVQLRQRAPRQLSQRRTGPREAPASHNPTTTASRQSAAAGVVLASVVRHGWSTISKDSSCLSILLPLVLLRCPMVY